MSLKEKLIETAGTWSELKSKEENIILEGKFADIDVNDSWVRFAGVVQKEFKRLKAGTPDISKSGHSRRTSFTITSKNPVEFQDGHVGRIRIYMSSHQVYRVPEISIVDPDLAGYSFGSTQYDLENVKPAEKSAKNKQKVLDFAKKLFPKSTMRNNIITITE